MVMAHYFPHAHDRLQELWQQIHQLHLTYLDTEDSPQKIEQRNKLEVCIRDYLCIAPHSQKFYCPETSEVLHRSASSKKDFSGYRAALAWNAVSMYAGNLLSQPWRKEYRSIKTYCGFYKHQIEANLVGAEAMFEAMGYKHAGDGILVLEGPVCPDRVAKVSQDSIVAFVECQILKTIWEEVSSNFKVSWLDVLEFRESHIYSPEQSIRMLNYRFHERRYQEQNRSTDTYSTVLRYPAPHPVQHLSHAPPLTGMHSFPPAAHHSHIPAHSAHYVPPITSHAPIPTHIPATPLQCPGQCMYANPYCNCLTYASAPYNPYRYSHGSVPQHYSVPHPCAPKQSCNGYCYPNGCVVAQPPYTYGVPTGQLIELDNPKDNENGCYDMVDSATKRQLDQLESHKQLAKSTNLDSLTLSKSKEDGAGTFESWDYVYRNLESQGYYKDLGERPDVLQQNESKKKSKKVSKPSIDIENEFNNLNLTSPISVVADPPLKINEALKKLKDHEAVNHHNRKSNYSKIEDSASRVAQSSSYDNISSQDSYNKNSNNLRSIPTKSISNGVTKTLPRERVPMLSPDKPNHVSSTLDSKKLRRQDVDNVKPKEVKLKGREENGGWSCHACTYLNAPAVEICVMCGKSKKTVEMTMAVGGSQCPVCTLVNPKEVAVCQACNSSLKNSPTYI